MQGCALASGCSLCLFYTFVLLLGSKCGPNRPCELVTSAVEDIISLNSSHFLRLMCVMVKMIKEKLFPFTTLIICGLDLKGTEELTCSSALILTLKL